MTMKKRYIVAAAMLLVAAYEIVTMPGPTKFQPYLPGVTDARSWLESNCRGARRDIDKCKATIAALEGSGPDALKLALSMPADDASGQHYWLHIASQNGSSEGMRRLAQALAELPDAQYGRVHRIRARFWMERAAQAGDAEAKNQLFQIPQVLETEAAEHRVPDARNSNPKLVCGPMPWWRVIALAWGDLDLRITTNQRANLSCEDMRRFEENALKGILDRQRSARILASNMSLIQSATLPSLWLDQNYWSTVAAENGDPGDFANLGFDLAYELKQKRPANPDFKIRGRFWLRSAAFAGDEGYPEVLNKIQNEDLATEWLREEP